MKVQHITSLFILMGGLVGCGEKPASSTEQKSEPTPTTQVSTDASSTTPTDVATYRVGTTGTAAPLSFQDERGSLVGIDIDVMQALSEREGFKVEFIPTKWEELFTSLENGQLDIVISGVTYNDERASKYGMSNSYFFSPAAIAYIDGKDKKPTTVAELNGLRVGALAGSKNEKIAKASGAAEVVVAKRGFEVFTMLAQNKIDAFVHGYLILKDYQKNYPDQKLVISTIEDKSQKDAQLVILTQKGNQKLIDKLNAGIDKLKADGTLDKVSDKYIGSENKP